MNCRPTNLKATLRIYARNLKVAAEIQKNESKAIVNYLIQNEHVKSAPLLAIFSAFPHEPDLRDLLEIFPNKIAFPKVEGESLAFYRVTSLKMLASGYQNIPEPRTDAELRITDWANEDILFIPGLLFDEHGGRLGSGKGFYDRFVKSLKKAPALWGVALSPMISQEPLAQDRWDLKLSKLITAERVFEF